MKLRLLYILAVVSTLIIGCKDNVKKADDLRLNNKYAEAVDLYRQSAEEGNAYAKWRLSKAYNNGDGVDFNEEVAWQLLNEAHQDGCPQATCDVALAYMYGHYGIEKDVEKGKTMMLNHCEKTQDSYSLSLYARMLLYGDIFDKNEEKALNILEKISDKSEAVYLWSMACVYYEGTENVEPDKNRGIDFIKKAFERGYKYGAKFIGTEYLNDNPPLQKDVTKGVEWFEKGIKKNSTDCMIAMADICLSADSVYSQWHDINRGLSLLEKAGRHGNGDAYAQLGVIYSQGENVYIDEEKAFEYYTKAYELNSGWGTNNLGGCYIDGTRCDKDIDKAIELFKKASSLGYGHSSLNLYRYYKYSDFLGPHQIDKILAKNYLLLAIKQGSCDANWYLGYEYYQGSDLFEKNLFNAFRYFKQAADMGNIQCCHIIALMYEKGEGCNMDHVKAKEYRDKTKSEEEGKEEEDN